jgi:hypothetical protein
VVGKSAVRNDDGCTDQKQVIPADYAALRNDLHSSERRLQVGTLAPEIL